MAQDKKGFILYADQKALFDKLPNDKAGELIKHIFSYVNDENPEAIDLLIEIAFEPIKQQLKRDLKKFETAKKQRSEAGKRSAELRKEQRNSTPVETVERKPTKSTVKDNVNVNVNDKVNDNVILLKKETKESNLVFPFTSENFVYQWQVWKTYKKEQHRFTYKSEASEQAALTQLQKMATNQERKAIEILHHTMANGWKGFVEPKIDPRKETQDAFQAVKDKINFDFSDGKLSFER